MNVCIFQSGDEKVLVNAYLYLHESSLEQELYYLHNEW